MAVTRTSLTVVPVACPRRLTSSSEMSSDHARRRRDAGLRPSASCACPAGSGAASASARAAGGGVADPRGDLGAGVRDQLEALVQRRARQVGRRRRRGLSRARHDPAAPAASSGGARLPPGSSSVSDSSTAGQRDAVGDAVVHARDQCAAGAVPVHDVHVPQRAGRIQRRHHQLAGQALESAAIAGRGQSEVVEVEVEVERPRGPPRPGTPTPSRGSDDALAEAREPFDQALANRLARPARGRAARRTTARR